MPPQSYSCSFPHFRVQNRSQAPISRLCFRCFCARRPLFKPFQSGSCHPSSRTTPVAPANGEHGVAHTPGRAVSVSLKALPGALLLCSSASSSADPSCALIAAVASIRPCSSPALYLLFSLFAVKVQSTFGLLQ